MGGGGYNSYAVGGGTDDARGVDAARLLSLNPLILTASYDIQFVAVRSTHIINQLIEL